MQAILGLSVLGVHRYFSILPSLERGEGRLCNQCTTWRAAAYEAPCSAHLSWPWRAPMMAPCESLLQPVGVIADAGGQGGNEIPACTLLVPLDSVLLPCRVPVDRQPVGKNLAAGGWLKRRLGSPKRTLRASYWSAFRFLDQMTRSTHASDSGDGLRAGF